MIGGAVANVSGQAARYGKKALCVLNVNAIEIAVKMCYVIPKSEWKTIFISAGAAYQIGMELHSSDCGQSALVL